MKKSQQPLMTAEQHRATSWNLFVAHEQIDNPLGISLWEIKPAKRKRQILQRRDKLQHSLDTLKVYLEQIAAQDIDPETAFDLYYPGRLERAPKTLTCSDMQLAQAFDAGISAKIMPDGRNGTPRFTITDFLAISDFLDTAIARKIELPLNIITTEMTNRKRRKEIQTLCLTVTASRLDFCESLRSVFKSLPPVTTKATARDSKPSSQQGDE